MEINSQDIYRIVLKDYPDVMDVNDVSKVLEVSTKTVYKLIREGKLQSMQVGRAFRIPKVILMKYIKIFGSTPAAQTHDIEKQHIQHL